MVRMPSLFGHVVDVISFTHADEDSDLQRSVDSRSGRQDGAVDLTCRHKASENK